MAKTERAFPVAVDGNGFVESPGFSKREYFAGLAMQGYLSNSANRGVSGKMIAELSVLMADALLEELAKPPEPQVEGWVCTKCRNRFYVTGTAFDGKPVCIECYHILDNQKG